MHKFFGYNKPVNKKSANPASNNNPNNRTVDSTRPADVTPQKPELNSNLNKTMPAVVPNLPLRKLGQIENIFHGSSEKSRSYIYRTIILSSKINLYSNLKVLSEAIQEWKNLNPLLRCRVVKANTFENVSKYQISKQNHFAFATEEKQKSLENVKFLYYKSNVSEQKMNVCDDIWKLLLEKETTLSMDGENGLLWR